MSSNLWLLVLTLIGLAVHLANFLGILLPSLIRFYLNDLLIVPICCSICLQAMRRIFGVPTLILLPWQVAFVVSFFSLMFELILPRYLDRYTADRYDVLMYVLGGVFYWNIMNKSRLHQ